MSLHGGGGQAGAGACVLAPGEADEHIARMLSTLKQHG